MYSDEDARQEQYDYYIGEKMHDCKEEVLSRLSTIVHATYLKEFVKMYLFSNLEDPKSVEKITDDFGFTDMEIAALASNFIEFKDLYEQHCLSWEEVGSRKIKEVEYDDCINY